VSLPRVSASPESSNSPFRPEAVAHHRRAASAEPLEPLRVSGARITGAYRAVGVLLLFAMAALCFVRVDARVRGRFGATRAPHRADVWLVSATFPWRYGAALVPGSRLSLLDEAGCLSQSGTILRTSSRASGGSLEASPQAEPLVATYAEVRGTGCRGREPGGAAEVTLGTAPLIGIFFPRLREPISRLQEAL
jgi:hypothetical protein